MYRRSVYAFAILIVMHNIITTDAQLDALRDFIQINIGGVPAIHTITQWSFDPEVGIKRRSLWQEVNGYRGDKLIERLGLGVDGREAERRERQRIRDEGHLGGLNYFRP